MHSSFEAASFGPAASLAQFAPLREFLPWPQVLHAFSPFQVSVRQSFASSSESACTVFQAGRHRLHGMIQLAAAAGASGRAAAGMLPQLCDPPGGNAQQLGKQPSGQLSCTTGLMSLPNSGGGGGGLNFAPGPQSLPFDQVGGLSVACKLVAAKGVSVVSACFVHQGSNLELTGHVGCALQALLQDFSAGLSGMEPLLHAADGLATDNSPVINFPDVLQ